MKNILKKNQLAILVIALMLVTAGYLNYTSKDKSMPIGANVVGENNYAAIGDATLVNSGELIEEKDKEAILSAIENANNNENTQNNIDKDLENKESSTNENEQVPTNAEDNADDYFTSSKLERDKMYSQMIETYQKLLESDKISEEQKAISEQEITKINQIKNAIMIAENLLSTKGFKNSVIFVNDMSVSVVVRADKLQPEQIAQIQNIVSRELQVEIENINISNK